jgi:hypothetical protein
MDADADMGAREGWRRLGRLGGRRLLAVAAALTVAVLAAVWLVRGGAIHPAPGAAADAPGWAGGAVACRQDPMAHVPHPTRFVVLASCATVSGTVRHVARDPADGELNMLVEVDQPYARFLHPDNHGLLRTTAVPLDVPSLQVPKAGQHATFHGAWVLDRNQRNLPAMHPVWTVQLTPGSAAAAPPAGARHAGGQRLVARMRAPRLVPVGGAMNVSVQVDSVDRKGRHPLPEANLFFEVSTGDGRGVQWKAASTNSLGLARVTLVALEQPGPFALRLYVDRLGSSTVVSVPFQVQPR